MTDWQAVIAVIIGVAGTVTIPLTAVLIFLLNKVTENGKAISENRKAISENGKAISENRKAISENGKAISENRKAISENGKAIKRMELKLEIYTRKELNRSENKQYQEM